MNRLATLAMTTMSLLFVGMALRASDGTSYAQQRSDSDNVNAAVNAFHAALSNLDIGKMQSVWAQEPYVVLINPNELRCAARGGRREIIKLEYRAEEEHNEPTCHARNDSCGAGVCGNCPASRWN